MQVVAAYEAMGEDKSAVEHLCSLFPRVTSAVIRNTLLRFVSGAESGSAVVVVVVLDSSVIACKQRHRPDVTHARRCSELAIFFGCLFVARAFQCSGFGSSSETFRSLCHQITPSKSERCVVALCTTACEVRAF